MLSGLDCPLITPRGCTIWSGVQGHSTAGLSEVVSSPTQHLRLCYVAVTGMFTQQSPSCSQCAWSQHRVAKFAKSNFPPQDRPACLSHPSLRSPLLQQRDLPIIHTCRTPLLCSMFPVMNVLVPIAFALPFRQFPLLSSKSSTSDWLAEMKPVYLTVLSCLPLPTNRVVMR